MNKIPRSREREVLLHAEVERLGHELEILERQWKQKHWLALFALAAIPAYLISGPFLAAIVIACTPILISVQAYLLAVRRYECRQLIGDAKRDLFVLEQSAQTSTTI